MVINQILKSSVNSELKQEQLQRYIVVQFSGVSL